MLSDDLEKTINRAVSYANDRQQEYVTLEHLLLALLDDNDALGVLNACNIDIKNLKISLIKYIDEDKFIEEKIDNIKPNFLKDIYGTHHMGYNEDYSVIDFVSRSS